MMSFATIKGFEKLQKGLPMRTNVRVKIVEQDIWRHLESFDYHFSRHALPKTYFIKGTFY